MGSRRQTIKWASRHLPFLPLLAAARLIGQVHLAQLGAKLADLNAAIDHAALLVYQDHRR